MEGRPTGNRIVVRVVEGDSRSPDLYCHWAGLEAVRAVHEALHESRGNVHNVMCNAVVKVMRRRCCRGSYYLYSSGEAENMADWDNWTWTYDMRAQRWTTTFPTLSGTSLTVAETERFIEGVTRRHRGRETHRSSAP